jgi:hypothetical protein
VKGEKAESDLLFTFQLLLFTGPYDYWEVKKRDRKDAGCRAAYGAGPSGAQKVGCTGHLYHRNRSGG